MSALLPPRLAAWFEGQNWGLHPHQREMLSRAENPATLLIAPTGGGKTLAGFLPSLAELEREPHDGLHTLYISPLKALAHDIRRNLKRPVTETGLNIRIEDRTGDTSQTQKKRQRVDPPHILLTTPESLALLLSYEDKDRIFNGLRRVVVDEIHALAESKRGDQLMLLLARLNTMVPDLRRVGLSATVENPSALAQDFGHNPDPCDILIADPGPTPDIAMLETNEAPPWSGGGGRYAIPAILKTIETHKTTLIFHNTRAQAEIFFHDLWMANTNALPIGIHHGSLSRDQRSAVEAAMVAGKLRAIVCTGSLDLGIDWGDVDLVIQVGAPKNVKRLVQRIGRSNHQYNAPSKALLVPANRFEVVECIAALDAVRQQALDGDPKGPGPLDVLCQHILICACSGPFLADDLFAEIRRVGAYRALTRQTFDVCLDYVATGGYALRAYDRWQRLKEDADGWWSLRDPRSASRIRMNIGTIIDSETLKVRMRGARQLGEVEEAFAASLSQGETFLIGGQIVRFEGLRQMVVEVSKSSATRPRVAVFAGTKFATTTQLSSRILRVLHEEDHGQLPRHTSEWIALQKDLSALPDWNSILTETFPHDGRAHICVYGFAGRNAQQTLGLLLTRRMEMLGLGPLGFVATDYATLIWGIDPVEAPAQLFDREQLLADFEDWLGGNAVMKRSFRDVATIAGLIERGLPQKRKTGRQATFSSDILYDTLRKYDPDHLLLKITHQEAMRGLIDFRRIEEMLDRTEGRINHRILRSVSPFAAPLMLEIGKVPIHGEGRERLETAAAAELLRNAGLDAH